MNVFTFLDKEMYLGRVSSHEMLLLPTFIRSQKDYDAQPELQHLRTMFTNQCEFIRPNKCNPKYIEQKC